MLLRLKASTGRLQNPSQTLDFKHQQLLTSFRRLNSGFAKNLALANQNLKGRMSLLNSLSPLNVLDRGYAIARVDGSVVTDVRNVKVGDLVEVRLASGELRAKIESIKQPGDRQ
jgi:exodeoxyribonuclease VII large subunit